MSSTIQKRRGVQKVIAMLRNVRIDRAMASVLIFFAINLTVIAALGFISSQMGSNALKFIHSADSGQMNELSRAEANLNAARVDLGTAAAYLVDDQEALGQRELEEAQAAISAAREHFSSFMAEPKGEKGEAMAGDVAADFEAVMALVEEQYQVLEEGYYEDFGFIRAELAPPAAAFRESAAAFLQHIESTVQQEVASYDSQVATFGSIGVISMLLSAVFLTLIYWGLRKMVIEPLHTAVTNINYIADADLSHELRDMGSNEVGQLIAAMQRMRNSLSGIVAEVRQGSDSIHTGAREIAAGNADLSSRTEQQASSLEETATSMEQLTATVKQNADNAKQASSMANEASSTATRGGEVVNEVIGTMRGISESSQKISDITGLIDSIAFQTNILALNASVEAARAGEQGRGFAVVAGEVRNLAGRSSEAAKEIKELIESSVKQVKSGSNLVEEAGATMDEVVAAVKRVTDIMDEISSASQEQSGGIEQVSQAVGQMDEVTQQNASLVQEAATAAASLEEQASRMEEIVSVFRIRQEIAQRELESGSESSLKVAPACDLNGARADGRSESKPAANGVSRPFAGNGAGIPAKATQTTEPEWVEF